MQKDDNQPQTKEPEAGNELLKSAVRETGKELVSEFKTTLLWALGGAVIGALALGGAGYWLLAMKGVGMGALAGAVAGAIAGGWVYLKGSSLID